MTEGMLAREALERKEKWAFMAEGVALFVASAPAFRERCLEMLASGLGSLDFETGLRDGLLAGAARGRRRCCRSWTASWKRHRAGGAV